MPALIIYEPGRPSRVFILRKARSLIGSSMLNDEAIRCKGVEPHHVAVEERGPKWFAVDKTGKGIDVIKLGRAAELGLLDGTEFMIGAARVRFDLAYTHDGGEPEARTGFSGSTAVVTKAGRKKEIDMAGTFRSITAGCSSATARGGFTTATAPTILLWTA
ncbi:MAG: hypothetical protein HY897_10235 [Deltaproteobacteria bacterium]|nr:hypothetical protein [Deltaproteobacteria bacterium]